MARNKKGKTCSTDFYIAQKKTVETGLGIWSIIAKLNLIVFYKNILTSPIIVVHKMRGVEAK
jgi:hypothetical protein